MPAASMRRLRSTIKEGASTSTTYQPKHRADVPVDSGPWSVLIRTGFDAPWVMLSGLSEAEADAEVKAYTARGVTSWKEKR